MLKCDKKFSGRGNKSNLFTEEEEKGVTEKALAWIQVECVRGHTQIKRKQDNFVHGNRLTNDSHWKTKGLLKRAKISKTKGIITKDT